MRSVDHEWLILVYIAGDNDLGQNGDYGNAALMDLEELESSIPQSGVRVLALTDLKGPSNSKLYDVRPDTTEGIHSPTIPLSKLDPSWTDEINSGSGKTVQKFIEFALTNTTFDRSMFVMWDHGSGWYINGDVSKPPQTRGFAQDQSSGSMMYLDDLRDAFQDAESTIGPYEFDIIGHDTCFMGMLEVFYQLAPWSKIATGSMDEQPWYGYNYTFISSLDGEGPHSASDLVSNMVDLFEIEYASSSDSYHTIVVADIEVLRSDFIEVWDMLSRSLYHRMYYLEEEENGLFNNVVGGTEIVGIESLDVGSLLSELIIKDLETNITDLARSAKSIYDRMVMDSWIKPDGRNPRGTGITVYLPGKKLAYKSIYNGSSGFLNFTSDSFWDEMIWEYQNPRERLRLNLSIIDVSGFPDRHDLKIDATDITETPPVPFEGVEIFVNGSLIGLTDMTGSFILNDISPGLYTVEAGFGELFDMASIKALNRPPIPAITYDNEDLYEGLELTFHGIDSIDPDKDLLTFRWDLDDSNGLDNVDSVDGTVKVTYPDEGTRTIRLTVNDSQTSAHIDRTIEVLNKAPIARIQTDLDPILEVGEDENFSINGSLSYDVAADMDELEYRFLLDGSELRNWSTDPIFMLSIPDAGLHVLSLEVRDMDGGSGNDSMTVQVLERDPVAVLTGPTSIFEDQQGTYVGNRSFDTPSDIGDLQFNWFVDGLEVPSDGGPVITVAWETSGVHRVMLEVTDDGFRPGIDDPARAEIEVQVMNRPPQAKVSGPMQAPVESKVNLSGSQSIDTISDLDDLIFSWDTDGDGEIDSLGVWVEFIPMKEGNLTVMLQVTDDDGDTSTVFHYIKVNNIAPLPNVSMPETVWEDEMLDIRVNPGWDSSGDEGGLIVTWELDGVVVAEGPEAPEISISFSGTHEIRITAIDDQGVTGYNTTFILVKNPFPNVVLGGIPVKIDVGEKFTANGYRTTDNPSDLPFLTFEWLVNGKVQDGKVDKNATFVFDSPGKRTIGLRVTDDDGDSYMVELSVDVQEDPLFSRLTEFAMSLTGLVVILVILLLTLILVFRVRSKMKELDPPNKGEKKEEEEAGSIMGTAEEENLSDHEEKMITKDFGKEPVRNEGQVPRSVPPPPDMSLPEIPAGPEPGRADMPEFDKSLFK